MFSFDRYLSPLGLGLLCVTLLTACGKDTPAPAQRPSPAVELLTIVPQTLPADLRFVAQTESSQRVEIMARVSGFLDSINYKEGGKVKEGELMFQLDPKPFQAQLEAAQGQLRMQQARLRTAEATYKRIKPLAKLNAVSQSDLDRATGDRDSASAAVYAAEADVKQAELDLGYTRIHAPLSGIASQSMQRQGAYINAMSTDSKLTYVAALDPIWVNFSVSQNMDTRLSELIEQGIITLNNGKKLSVELLLSDNKVYAHEGVIDFSDPSYSQSTGTALVRAVIPNPDHTLRPGMFVTAKVKGALRPNAIVIPQLAVMQGEKGHFVYVIKSDNTAEVRPVLVGDYYGEAGILILNGLLAGDRVVVNGMLKVQPGKPVSVSEPQAATAKASPTQPSAQ
jgi:membrane fusion protein (multidrug efflux system)